jgi:hypothetical protein
MERRGSQLMTVAHEVCRMTSPVTRPGRNIETAWAEMVVAIAGYSMPLAVGGGAVRSEPHIVRRQWQWRWRWWWQWWQWWP